MVRGGAGREHLGAEFWVREDLALQRGQPTGGEDQHDTSDQDRLAAVRARCVSDVLAKAATRGGPGGAAAALRQLRRDRRLVRQKRQLWKGSSRRWSSSLAIAPHFRKVAPQGTAANRLACGCGDPCCCTEPQVCMSEEPHERRGLRARASLNSHRSRAVTSALRIIKMPQ